MGGPFPDPSTLPEPDRLRAMLRTTEGRLANARRVQEDRELRLRALTRAGRRTVQGSRLAGLVETGASAIANLETTLAGIRHELGLADLPTRCPAVRHGAPCELPFGHEGMHLATGDVRTRWE